jgi:hypothetical protein
MTNLLRCFASNASLILEDCADRVRAGNGVATYIELARITREKREASAALVPDGMSNPVIDQELDEMLSVARALRMRDPPPVLLKDGIGFGDPLVWANTDPEFGPDPRGYRVVSTPVQTGSFSTVKSTGLRGLAVRLACLTRLRKRGRTTLALRKLGNILGATRKNLGVEWGEDAAVWWTPDLDGRSEARAAAKWIEHHFCGARIVGVGSTSPNCSATSDNKDLEKDLVAYSWVEIALPGEEHKLRLCTELLAMLSSYSALRPRTVELLATLRARALMWCKSRRVPWSDVALFLPGTLVGAMLMSRQEEAAVVAMESRGMNLAVGTMGTVAAGQPRLARTHGRATLHSVHRLLCLVRDMVSEPRFGIPYLASSRVTLATK